MNTFKTTLSYLYSPNKNSSVQEQISGEALAFLWLSSYKAYFYLYNLSNRVTKAVGKGRKR